MNSFTRILLSVSIALCSIACPGAFAKDGGKGGNVGYPKQEVRLSVGDMCFESVIWHNQIHCDYSHSAPDSAPGWYREKNHYSYTPHIAVDYSYSVRPWLGVGVVADFQMTFWHSEVYNNTNGLVRFSKENFYNLCLMPQLRFNYFRREHVGLYSAIAAGLDINGGTEVDIAGNRTAVGAGADIRFLGIQAGGGHWWGFAELGGLYGIRNTNAIYMMNSAIVKAGISYKF